MISRRVRIQLLVFVMITLVGVAYTGARYARLGRLFLDTSYPVHAHFAESGGIFTGAEVAYRGVKVGRVSDMQLTRDGVDVVLSIDNDYDKIPADTLARVSNLSAVGEQYVDLEPNTDAAPYLHGGSTIETPSTRTPVSTTELLTNLVQLVDSVPKDDLRTVVTELGTAFHGTGPALSRIVDTSTSFIDAANRNFETTTALIRDSRTVLQTQIDETSAIRGFSRNLSLFSQTLADHDRDLRRLIDQGSATAVELRTFLERNRVDLGRLIGNLVTTGQVTVKHLPGIRQILVLFPYTVAGGYTVAAKVRDPASRDAGHFDAHFGLVLTNDPPYCKKGYDPTPRRSPSQRGNVPMDTRAHCAEPPSQSDARGAQNAPRAGEGYRPPVATYDVTDGSLSWADQVRQPTTIDTAGSAAVFGKDAWKWLLLRPALGIRD